MENEHIVDLDVYDTDESVGVRVGVDMAAENNDIAVELEPDSTIVEQGSESGSGHGRGRRGRGNTTTGASKKRGAGSEGSSSSRHFIEPVTPFMVCGRRFRHFFFQRPIPAIGLIDTGVQRSMLNPHQSQVIFHQQLLSLDTTVPIPSIKLQILPSKFQRPIPAIGLIDTDSPNQKTLLPYFPPPTIFQLSPWLPHYPQKLLPRKLFPQAICNYCGLVMQGHYSQGTNHLINHAKRCPRRSIKNLQQMHLSFSSKADGTTVLGNYSTEPKVGYGNSEDFYS
ncbi:hypothetical protein WN944_006581 [Citrus x changshan-huyou]|uniref:BED-type domain-containing protein n=1 Tax=Citrus x changshan-huyou TaxID=2935761 RepID=A0AAP0QPR9_9ROSI